MLFELVESSADRRQRELYEQAVAQALAHHDPEHVGALMDRDVEEDEESEFDTPAWAQKGDG